MFGSLSYFRSARSSTTTQSSSNDGQTPYDKASLVESPPPPYSIPTSSLGANKAIEPDRSDGKNVAQPRPRGPSQASQPWSATARLRRYLIEIVGFTFDVDFDELNSALYRWNWGLKGTTSILCETERNELERLSALVKGLHQMSRRNDLNMASAKDRNDVYKSIIVPAYDLPTYFNPDYALDLIASYADHQCIHRQSTNVKYWARNSQEPFGCSNNLKKALASHALMIGIISPNEQVQHILGRGLKQYQDGLGLNVETGTMFWPIRDGFRELEYTIRTWNRA